MTFTGKLIQQTPSHPNTIIKVDEESVTDLLSTVETAISL